MALCDRTDFVVGKAPFFRLFILVIVKAINIYQKMMKKLISSLLIGTTVLTTAITPDIAKANTRTFQGRNQIHLDVDRYCRNVFAAGNQWAGRIYSRDGRHAYRNGRHYCRVHYRPIINVTNSRGGNAGFNLGVVQGGGNSSRDVQRTQVGAERVIFEDVWLDKACRSQGDNGRYTVQGVVVWCDR
ncbi:hypothetical protein IQ215_02665 [Cyanobacterium stanieri LEGE 03274]|uniref:Uncharacterized protein n=1 Tax=Cyanobacterium stanieri LEGE 03274 TaxID=1828756 RepID=A0ABR9V125_9CHRO|nr:hypothetical protein [Cyanobacterium stanieri]MBE9221590.1 hypothetical protein [Cyanobacterium stanieri LEGE 03274]